MKQVWAHYFTTKNERKNSKGNREKNNKAQLSVYSLTFRLLALFWSNINLRQLLRDAAVKSGLTVQTGQVIQKHRIRLKGVKEFDIFKALTKKGERGIGKQ